MALSTCTCVFLMTCLLYNSIFFAKLLIRNSFFNVHTWTGRKRLLEMIMQKHKFAP